MADGVANRLLGYCLLLMSGVPTEQKQTEYGYSFGHESGRLKLWAHGFDAIDGYLDEVLKRSKYLREPTILLLTDLASCLVGVFKGAKNEHARSQLGKAIQDAINYYPHIDNICYDSDSEGSQGPIVEELHDIIDSLYKLAPALNDVVEELRAPENPKPPPITEFYRRFILDKLPDARPYLILRLAEGNTKCNERLRSLAERGRVPTDAYIQQNIKITVSDAPLTELSQAQPSLYDSGVGTSYASGSALSSCSAAKDRPSLPRIPESSGPKAGFSCPFCARLQSQIDNSRKWRKHIYSDIKPYMCTYENCTEAQESFGSTRHWMSHLNWHKSPGALQRHSDSSHKFLDDSGSDVDSCPLCFKEFVSSPAKLYRHISHHMEDIRIFALPPSYRQLEDGYSGDDNSSNTGVSVEGSKGSGLSVIIEEYSPGTAPNSLKLKLKSQGMLDKKELVGDWVSVSSFRSDKHDEDISPNFEDSGETLGSDHSTKFSNKISWLSDKRMKTDANDQIELAPSNSNHRTLYNSGTITRTNHNQAETLGMAKQLQGLEGSMYRCPYFLNSPNKKNHQCRLEERSSLKTLYRHVARKHLKALACPGCTMRFGQKYELSRHRGQHSAKGKEVKADCKGLGSHSEPEAPSEKLVGLDNRARACRNMEELCEVLMPNGQVEYDYQKISNSTGQGQPEGTEDEDSDRDGTQTISDVQAHDWVKWVLMSPLTDEELIAPVPEQSQLGAPNTCPFQGPEGLPTVVNLGEMELYQTLLGSVSGEQGSKSRLEMGRPEGDEEGEGSSQWDSGESPTGK